jgi:transcriptional regulator with XRE-family HTH domain
LALEAEIPRSYMSGIERGVHTPSLETIAKLLPLFEITWVDFFREFESRLRKPKRNRA